MPLKSALHVDKLLSNVSVQYKNEEYVWNQLFPTVMVQKDTDLFRVYDRNFKIPETVIADGGVAREHNFEFSNSSYALEKHGLKDYVSDESEEQNDQGSLKADTVENLTDAIYRRMEYACSRLFTTTNWSLNLSLAANNTWADNTVATDPVRIMDTAASTIIANSGKTPNFGFIPRDGFVAVKNHQSVLDRVKYTNDKVTKVMLASLFELPELIIPQSVYDTAAKGVTPSMTNFFGDCAFVGWKPSSPGLKTPSCGYTFMGAMPRVRTWVDEERESTGIQVKVKYQFKVVASLTGYLINNVY